MMRRVPALFVSLSVFPYATHATHEPYATHATHEPHATYAAI